jgi:hypothetical protein
MRVSRPPRAVLLGALAGLAALLGCGRAPTEPSASLPRTYANPQFVRVPGPPPGALSSGPADPSASGGADIDGQLGGVLTVGRFAVVVPPGAFDMVARVTITVPDTTVMMCQLGISPPEANDFQVPVTLGSDCGNIPGIDPGTLATLWYDPARAAWVELPRANGLTGAVVQTPLSHFSEYGVVDPNTGKSGW